MKVILSEEAKTDFKRSDGSVRPRFVKLFDKIETQGPGRHLGFGVPLYVEESGQYRVTYRVEDGVAIVQRCFSTHKTYEKWYKALFGHS